MKCPRCEKNQQYKYGMRCRCGYQFRFDPKRDGIADGKFLAAIRAASSNDSYYFTPNQLYAALCRKKSFGLNLPLIGRLFQLLHFPPTQSQVDSFIETWQRCGHHIDKLIQQPRLHQPPPEWKEPDIYDYGVERLLVVERDLLVDLFVLNGFHSQQRALVLSENGYPEYLMPVAHRTLERNTELPIFLLHDSTAHGQGLETRMRQSQSWPMEGHPVIDLGFAPDDVAKLRRLRATKPSRSDYAVPVDLLMFPMLLTGLSQAFDEQVSLAVLLDRAESRHYDSGVTDFG